MWSLRSGWSYSSVYQICAHSKRGQQHASNKWFSALSLVGFVSVIVTQCESSQRRHEYFSIVVSSAERGGDNTLLRWSKPLSRVSLVWDKIQFVVKRGCNDTATTTQYVPVVISELLQARQMTIVGLQ